MRLRCVSGRSGWCWSTRAITPRNGKRRDQGLRVGPSSEEQARIKALEREVRELRQANEILRKASAYFAMAELDRRSRP